MFATIWIKCLTSDSCMYLKLCNRNFKYYQKYFWSLNSVKTNIFLDLTHWTRATQLFKAYLYRVRGWKSPLMNTIWNLCSNFSHLHTLPCCLWLIGINSFDLLSLFWPDQKMIHANWFSKVLERSTTSILESSWNISGLQTCNSFCVIVRVVETMRPMFCEV